MTCSLQRQQQGTFSAAQQSRAPSRAEHLPLSFLQNTSRAEQGRTAWRGRQQSRAEQSSTRSEHHPSSVLQNTSGAEHTLSCAIRAEQPPSVLQYRGRAQSRAAPPCRAAEQGRAQSRGAAGAGARRRARTDAARERAAGDAQQADDRDGRRTRTPRPAAT